MAAAPATTNPTPVPKPDDPQSGGSPGSTRRLSPPCWSHEETLALIDAYREKWYGLRRGNLRASHWQEVADALRRRCRRVAAATAGPKTAVQCRHKVEKLRQRYRAEKQRLALRGNASRPRSSSWAYFSKMDAMELGTSAVDGASSWAEDTKDGHRGGGIIPKNTSTPRGRSGEGGGEGAGGGLMSAGLKFQIPKALRSKPSGPRTEERANAADGAIAAAKPNPSNGFFKGFSKATRTLGAEGVGEGAEARKKGGFVWEVVAAVKMLGDEFTRVEEMKMEMVRDVEKLRREMELKRTELILDSQRRIVDCIRGLHEKKAKVAPKS